jgi:integrase
MANNKLTNTQIKAVSQKGRLSDGGGLYLNVSKTGSKSWLFMWTRNGRRREMGLGSLETGTATVSLAMARQKAEEIRTILGRGGDPFSEMQERIASRQKLTFGQAANDTIDALRHTWRNEKSEAQWRMTLLENYAKPLCNRPVDEITTEDVVRILKPIWLKKAETARRLRARIEKVLDHAKVRGERTGDNPAKFKGHLDHILPKAQKLQRGHHAAMPYIDTPSFIKRLQEAKGSSARALELTILCATRTSETLNAKWEEIDLDKGLWTIPAERMKALNEHRIPLSVPAISLLRLQYSNHINDYIFAGQAPNKPLSNMAMAKVLKSLCEEHYTVHGFRSSFRDWAGEETNFSREISEQALAHVIGSTTERAYRRGDSFEKRRKLMNAWASYLFNANDGVIKLHG